MSLIKRALLPILILLLCAGEVWGGASSSFTEVAYRCRNDDGDETTATWLANQNTPCTMSVDTNYRLRLEIQETAAAGTNNKTFQLECQLNSGGFFNVTGTSTIVRSSASPNLADAANLTDQLTVGTGTFQGGNGFDEVNGVAGGAAMDIAASGHAEIEYSFQVRGADVANNDTIECRAAAIAAWTVTASITVSEAAPSCVPQLTLVGVGAC